MPLRNGKSTISKSRVHVFYIYKYKNIPLSHTLFHCSLWCLGGPEGPCYLPLLIPIISTLLQHPFNISLFFSFQLMANMFGSMSSTFTLAGDLPLFLNVLSGALLLHCEDTAILRTCLATFINASRHFKQVSDIHGFHNPGKVEKIAK